MLNYTPADWYWIIGGDEDRYWSSAVAAYVEVLPEGAGVTRIASEDELSGVLAAYGLPGPVPIVPDHVSPAQAEIALYRYDDGALLAQVNALIDAYPYEPVRIWWRKATRIDRSHSYLTAVALELGLSDDAVDELFIAADRI